MSKKRWNRGPILAILAVFSLSTVSYAQRTTGDITGTVTDTTGGVLPGVTVSAVCAETRFHADRGDRRHRRVPLPSCRFAPTG